MNADDFAKKTLDRLNTAQLPTIHAGELTDTELDMLAGGELPPRLIGYAIVWPERLQDLTDAELDRIIARDID